jgi:phenylacetate-CoA ligase
MEIKAGLSSHARIKLQDIFKGSNVLHYYKEYIRMMNQDRESLNNYRLKRFKELVGYAYSHIEFYKELYSKEHIKPEDIRTLDDIALLPAIDRIAFQQYYTSFKKQVTINKKVISGSSSGSTGTPVRYETDMNGHSAGIASKYALYSMSGWSPGKKNYYIWGNKYSIKQWNTSMSKLRQIVFRQKNVPSTSITESLDLSVFINSLIRFSPFSIEGYANSIHHLAVGFRESNLAKPKSLHVVFTTAENLEQLKREEIEQIFAPVSDLYGCGEINGIAVQPIHEHKYFVLDPHVIVECIKDNPSDMMGEIVVTDLDNFYMPLIRYKPGDLIDGVSECKDNDLVPFSSFGKIYGRSSDFLMLPDQRKLYPVTIFGGTAFRKIPAITKHKVIWDGLKLTMLFEASAPVDLIQLDKIVAEILNDFPLRYEIRIIDKILPDPITGKYKYFTNSQ